MSTDISKKSLPKQLEASGAATLKNKVIKAVTLFFLPIVVLAIWEAVCGAGLVPRLVLPAPSLIGDTLVILFKNGELFRHLSISLLRVLEGYLLGAAMGIFLGALIGLFKPVETALTVFTGILRPIPVMAWVPLVILWMGIDEASKITLIAIGTFWTVLINVVNGIKNTDKKYIEVAYIFEKNKFTLFTKVILPSALPFIFTGLRVGVDVAWRSVVGAEVIAAASGMGYMIQFARELGQTDVMLVGIFTIGLMGLLIDFLLKKLQKATLKWDQSLGKQQ